LGSRSESGGGGGHDIDSTLAEDPRGDIVVPEAEHKQEADGNEGEKRASLTPWRGRYRGSEGKNSGESVILHVVRLK